MAYSDRELLARLIECEAGGEGESGIVSDVPCIVAADDLAPSETVQLDGANRFQRIRHIEIPQLIPTAMIILIMRIGSLMSMGFEKVYLLQNDLNSTASEIIATYVYKVGLVQSAQYSYSSAIGLLNSLVNLTLLLFFNAASRRLSETSLW